MNMQKYASYKKAAKRIVRLLNEEREMKKEAGNLFFPPIGPDAPQMDAKGNPLQLVHPAKGEPFHPLSYLNTTDGNGINWGVPLSWFKKMPDGLGNESHENYDLSTGERRPYFVSSLFDPTGSIARERDKINEAISENAKRRNASGREPVHVPGAKTTSRYNAKNGWREHAWLKPWTWRMFGK